MATNPTRPQRPTLLSRVTALFRPEKAADEVSTTIAILRAQQEATLDGILVVNRDRRILSYNRRFVDIWGIPPEVAATSGDQTLLGYAVEAVADSTAFLDGVEALYRNPLAIQEGESIELKDGRTPSRTTVPVTTSDGVVTGRAWYFRDITESRRSEKLQSALFRISQLSRESSDLPAFYAAIHRVVGELMDATNFYIAEYDATADILTFPYFVDQFDAAPEGRAPGRTLTGLVLRTGKPALITPERFEVLEREGEVESIGAPSVDWLGVPLRSGDRTWGVLGAQTYDERRRYTSRDEEVLVFVSEHVASASEHKRKEEALRESERRYRQIFENTRAVQIIIDPSTGDIVDANMAACDFYGYTLDDLRSMKIWNINVLSEARVREEMRNAAQQERSYFAFQHKRANGEIRDVEVHSGPIELEGRNLLYSIVHDVTERKRTERALQQSEEKYRSIFDHASVGILQSTRDGHLITANSTLARMLGYDSVDELLQVDMSR